MIERTLVLVKPDGVQRGLVGEIVKRFEQRGLKIVGMKMVWADEEFAKKHYTEDITKRRGEQVRKRLLKYITSGPVVAVVLEGIGAVEIVRKLTGETEPRAALPGTIRGDFAHHGFAFADAKDMSVLNLIHSSGNKEEASVEIALWFSPKELHTYKRSDEGHHFGD